MQINEIFSPPADEWRGLGAMSQEMLQEYIRQMQTATTFAPNPNHVFVGTPIWDGTSIISTPTVTSLPFNPMTTGVGISTFSTCTAAGTVFV